MARIAHMVQKVRRVVRRRGAPPDEIDDIVQEAFLRVESYERANEVRSKEATLVRAAVNISIDVQRRRSRSPFAEDVVDAIAIDTAPPSDEVLAIRQRLERVSAGIEALNERTRRILLARRLEGLPYEQIAARENMSVAAVEKQVARATLFLMRWADEW